ncbi:hypothetical protein [Bradyrhizobium sp. 192]|uniref:hypothetical protein n=1 Tax=Bradyrhizobium sp. 192 TaxID=2782660 RepID=UPI001FFE894C|nr:hypothetical protein [Bradyrhizobium sp. 192]UPJ56237.1 hypothetical protein IVB24_26930 [Bradyrhizobium sp. 192]
MRAFAFLLTLLMSLFAVHAKAACIPDEIEKAVWQAVANSSDPAQIRYYLDSYPKGCFRKLAILKLDNILPVRPALKVIGNQQGGGELVGANGSWIIVQVNGGKNSFQKLKVVPMYDFAAKIGFYIQCDAAGNGLTPYLPDGGPCPSGNTPFIQGFGLRLTGEYAAYYDLRFECKTIRYQGVGETNYGPTNDWCGVRNPTPETWIKGVKVDVVRNFSYKEKEE